jgi:hypothetical protein
MVEAALKAADSVVGERNRSLHEIWKLTAGGRFAPRRAEITLPLVRALTPWLWMVDVLDRESDFRIRLAGDGVNQFLGGAFTGQPLSRLPHSVFIDRLRRALRHGVDHKVPVALGPIPSGHTGKEHWEMELIALPLSENDATVNCLMGTIELWPLGTYTPHRADVTS